MLSRNIVLGTGGSKRNRLFMAASQSLYAVYVDAQSAHITQKAGVRSQKPDT